MSLSHFGFRPRKQFCCVIKSRSGPPHSTVDIPDPQLRNRGGAGEGGTKARSIISLVLQSGGKRGERREEMALQIFRMHKSHVGRERRKEGRWRLAAVGNFAKGPAFATTMHCLFRDELRLNLNRSRTDDDDGRNSEHVAPTEREARQIWT